MGWAGPENSVWMHTNQARIQLFPSWSSNPMYTMRYTSPPLWYSSCFSFPFSQTYIYFNSFCFLSNTVLTHPFHFSFFLPLLYNVIIHILSYVHALSINNQKNQKLELLVNGKTMYIKGSWQPPNVWGSACRQKHAEWPNWIDTSQWFEDAIPSSDTMLLTRNTKSLSY